MYRALSALLVLTAAGPAFAIPEVPAVVRDVSLMDEPAGPGTGHAFTTAVVPPYRTSADGRLAIDMKKQGGQVFLTLFTPEALSAPVVRSGPGVHGVSASSYSIPHPYIHGSSTGAHTHTTICDPTSQFPSVGGHTNPYPCVTNPANDCYDVTLISTIDEPGSNVMLWGKNITVEVQDPKTAAASIFNVTETAPAVSNGPFPFLDLFEPMVTSDGHLIVARAAKTNYAWPPSSPVITQDVDIVYAVHPPGGNPCDVTAWTVFHPISHAPSDPDMSSYGIAQYPFRDPSGTLIPDGVDIQASYPWIDRDGDNIFFTTIKAMLYYTDPLGVVQSRHPASCVAGYACDLTPTAVAEESRKNFQGVGFAGLWSHGKMVQFDASFNNTDYGMGRTGDLHRMVSLYVPGSDASGTHSGDIRVGTGRSNGTPGWPGGTTQNFEFMDSFENLFNHLPDATPLTIRDVVWTMNVGRTADEIAFDDYLDPDALIIMDGTGSMALSTSNNYLDYFDGFVPEDGTPMPINFQNSATAVPPVWAIPAGGQATNARVEPVALGGVVGKGVWLEKSSSVEFNFPNQPQNPVLSDSYLGIYVDPRFPSGNNVPRRLVTFPDGTAIALRGMTSVALWNGAAFVHDFVLPTSYLSSHDWTHLGFVIHAGGGTVDFFLDGFLFETFTGAGPLLQVPQTGGPLRVGAVNNDGVTAWIDDFKLIKRQPGVEVACNHARGTLVGVTTTASPALRAQAMLFPLSSHLAISATLAATGGPIFPRYACFTDHADPLAVNLSNLPAGTTSVRDALIFPEGPLVNTVPRPDSTANTFCLSCHVAGQPAELSPAALVPASMTMHDDPRRQPMQPPRLVYGNVPASYANSEPTVPTVGPVSLDQWVYP